jgi:hypothetical protein
VAPVTLKIACFGPLEDSGTAGTAGLGDLPSAGREFGKSALNRFDAIK